MSLIKRIKRYFGRNEGILFIAPWVIGFLLFVSFPLAFSFYMSFNNVTVTANGIRRTYAGLQYYRSILFEDGSALYDQLIPFLQQAALMIPIIVVFSFMIAILLNQKFPGRGFFRALFFLPVIFNSGGVIEKFMEQGQGTLGMMERYSITETITTYLPEAWATPITSVMNSFVLILWYSGVQILLFLAGRQTINPSVYEAARIDGATPWEAFWKITLPAMTPFIFLNVIYTIVELFTFPSNPIISSVSTSAYGHSSALVWIYFTIIMVFLGIIFLLFAKLTKGSATRAH